MELDVLFSGMCLFTEKGNGWQVRVIEGENPGGVVSRDGQAAKRTVLHPHSAEIWVETGIPVPGRAPDDNRSVRTELSNGQEVEVKVYDLKGNERLSFEVVDAAGQSSPLPPFGLDPTFLDEVASLSAIDTTVSQAALRALDASPLAANVEIDRGVLSSHTRGEVERWEGSNLDAQPLQISTSALWRLEALGQKVRIRSSQRGRDIEIAPVADRVKLWIVSYPVQAHPNHPQPTTAGHFKWYYELYDFNGQGPADELAHPVPPQPPGRPPAGDADSASMTVSGSTTFCLSLIHI